MMDAVSGFATLVWPPTGISLAALLIFGYRLWPGITLGAFLVNLSTGAPLLSACGMGLGNTLEALLGAYLLKRSGFQNSLERRRDVLQLVVLAALLSTMASATIGVSSLWLSGVIPLASYIPTWKAWWVGDILGDLVIASLLLVWSRRPGDIQPRRIAEIGVLALSLVSVNLIVFRGLFSGLKSASIAYMIFLPLIWASLRFGQRGAVTASLATSILAIWGTAQGFGPFASGTLSESLFLLQTFMGVVVVTTMILAAVVSERVKSEETIRHMAYHDALTNLPNRLLFKDRLALELAHAKRSKQLLAVIFLDLDQFKNVNDILGHSMGDRLLKSVSEQLTKVMREGDTIARFGGDEFVILSTEILQAEDAAKIAQRIIEAIKHPLLLNGREFYITASIGISIYPNDGGDVETLTRNADIAMYQAKESGRDRYRFYDLSMSVRVLMQLELENRLRQALEREEFVVHYQLMEDTNSGKIAGIEALVRWQHPDRGLLYPNEFIPLAEESGLILPVGEWILHTACAQNKAWQRVGFPPMRIYVNLSTRQFKQRDLVETVARTLEATNLEAHWLGLEIVESVAIEDISYTIEVISQLRQMGIWVSIDDFGIGYSSLNYLKFLPINALKISQSFIRDVGLDSDNNAIVEAIIVLAKNLRLKVIAEGIETEEQLNFLRERGCEEIQGSLIAKPMPALEFEKILKARMTS